MRNQEPDYTRLSLRELLDVERHIDRDQVPERWSRLQSALEARRSGIAPAGLTEARQPIGRVLFTFMHMFMTVVVLVVLLVAFPGEGGEASVAQGLALFLVVPAAFVVSAGSVLLHGPFLRARRPRVFLLFSLLLTPFASVAVLVFASSILLIIPQRIAN